MVVLAGQPQDTVLSAVGKSLNVVLVRPERDAPGGRDGAKDVGSIETAVWALRRAAGISAPYVLVAADPLAAVAAEWQAMWEITARPRGAADFEIRVAQALAAWRAKQFELPDYYLVVAEEAVPPGTGSPGGGVAPAGVPTAAATAPGSDPGARPDFYLGPLRSVRPHRVAVVAAAEPAAQAAAVLSELGSLRHGPWWPSLDEIFRTARGFYPGSLAESPQAGQAGQATLLS